MTARTILSYPLVFFVISVIVLWTAARIGALVRSRAGEGVHREDFGVILAATLTLLGLIIGFSFSMATARYDQRKAYEEAEANAIGTEYLRAQLLPNADAVRVSGLLRSYLEQRILFYRTRDEGSLAQINARTAQLQAGLWSAARAPALAKPTPVNALVLSGMNDVLNAQGYTQAAWWNRIPLAAWGLMLLIAVCCNVLIGYGAHQAKGQAGLFVILPLLASIAFLLIADLDSPRGGLIRVRPQNLLSLSDSLQTGVMR
jgi:hypothetical protein